MMRLPLPTALLALLAAQLATAPDAIQRDAYGSEWTEEDGVVTRTFYSPAVSMAPGQIIMQDDIPIDFVDEPQDGDKEFTFDDVQVCVDKKSYLFINGTELDWEADLIRQQFVFNNPLAKRSCSCGESFAF